MSIGLFVALGLFLFFLYARERALYQGHPNQRARRASRARRGF